MPLTAPQSFAVDLGTVIARANQAAASQSATILAAANNISRQRERAGQAAADALFRERLHRFQQEQFAQKARIENERLAISQDQNERANELQPFNVRSAELGNQLKEVAIKNAPVQTAILGQTLIGSRLKNQAGAIELGALPDQLGVQQRANEARADILGAEAAIDVRESQRATDIFDRQSAVLQELNDLIRSPRTTGRLIEGPEIIKRLHADNKMEISLDPELSALFNDAVDRFAVDENLKIAPPAPSVPQPPEGFDITGFQSSTNAQGATSFQAQFARDVNDRPSPAEVNRSIDAVKSRGQARTASAERELDSVEKEITELNKQLLKASGEQAGKIRNDLEERQGKREVLNTELRSIEAETAQEIDRLINLSQRDSFPDGNPSISPRGPSTSIVGPLSSPAALGASIQ